MSDRRTLQFETEDDVLREIARLRKGYRRHGNWTLAQICWHVSVLIEKYLEPPASHDAKRTAGQEKMKAEFVDFTVANRRLPEHAKHAGPFAPPATANDTDIERFIAQLKRLKEYPHKLVEMGPIGPVPINECRIVHLVHAAHHLSFLAPMPASPRVGLMFADEDAVAKDVQTLRPGYAQTGNWTLAQMCWHLNAGVQARMQPGPFPPNTPEQDARAPVVRSILNGSKLLTGIEAVASMMPPTNAGETDIETLLASLSKFKVFPGLIPPHRIFGHMPDADARRLNLIHCAHHLSHLVPLQKIGEAG